MREYPKIKKAKNYITMIIGSNAFVKLVSIFDIILRLL